MIPYYFKTTVPQCLLYLLIFALTIASCSIKNKNTSEVFSIKMDSNTYEAKRTAKVPIIDGFSSDSCWNLVQWDTLDQIWLGTAYSKQDFTGRYKLVWDDSLLYLLAEISDDYLVDNYENPLMQYWDDDCLEVFIDEDNSGGIHQYNHQAFAYHISPVMNVIDIGSDQKPTYYNHHIKGKLVRDKTDYTWEIAFRIYGSNYSDTITNNQPIKLSVDKILGFSLAYCDNDTSEFRENFIGSVNSWGHYNNDGWIDASCFGKLVLIE